MDKKKITVALAGNPNSGKTTLFNALTGARQHVGNYPGVTVEKKEGTRNYKDCEIKFVDLPGTYSLTAYSVEEIVARNFIIDEHPDVVVQVVDSSNLERNLYLGTQLMEMGTKLVLAFNMSDVAKQRGYKIDIPRLSGLIQCPIVETIGNKGGGLNQLLDVIVEMASTQKPQAANSVVRYGSEIEEELERIICYVDQEHDLVKKYGKRWLAVKLLEQDKEILDKGHKEEVVEVVSQSVERIKKHFGDEPEIVFADKRYGFISGACTESAKQTVEYRHTVSDLVDKVILNRFLGLIIFAVLMLLVFQLTFWLGSHPMDWIEGGFELLGVFITGLWPEGSESALKSLLVDGIIGGVGGVIVFLPNILLLFLAIAFLEDSGYMARAAFLMDRIMHKIGLHGKSFIPMLIGFGCSVPAMMGTRILENKRSRFTTLMVIPLMSCGARYPIYMLIIPAFFVEKVYFHIFRFNIVTKHGLLLWSIYLIGILLAIILSWLLRKTLFKGDTTPFVMELPPYRMPTLRGLLTHMWQRGGEYLKKAGTVILAISIVMWALSTYPKPSEEDLAGLTTEEEIIDMKLSCSYAGQIGSAMEPVVRPMGFDDKIGTALVGALAAKEVFVSQLGVVYSLGETEGDFTGLRDKLREKYTALQGFCIMLFCLVSAPCVATVAVCKRETNSWKWALFQFFGLTVIAYILTVIVYQVGSLFVS